MENAIWLFLAPLVFVWPGLLPARLITGRPVSGWTFAWALFFGITILPPLAFGLAMLLGTTVDGRLVVPLAFALGLPGLFVPRSSRDRSDANPGSVRRT